MSADKLIESGGPCEWLIRKDGYFYRPNKSGYTTVKSEAGRYTELDARLEAEIEPWHMAAIHQDDVPDPIGDFNVSEIASLKAALASIHADNLRLRESLEPFGKAAGCHSDDKSFMPDEMLIWRGGECAIRLGDLRAARSLSQAGEGEQ
ncbi:hypothetical protein FJ973_29845 [Mesorhizobium sp. B2-1-3]|uniref:hypothetical protein n=1 Tax=Mesorhizobium sp. B2-1-3 TaxID=2589972 RepID=UPI001126621B|nr:hypothetical protein [Mesorhizobium sp. B2-1-3]TPN03847.1 hypothetical protein FJ973_29845 [Mesorhizobium sp. B2-1-3]